ncbi:hypothetical protein OJ997_27485 [Solirubrobacter phytolaccae]|uniref:Uncharacterized protein n=1 Tax=Solirubrobacter phytolaccae TaxID=1404360 RepID=A0A9X3SIA1_9ACTN|nr:hypothetical protein [Solirubrobacter phytolaccae]MDA0184082.1 hypothetical protein [Solirubrobacter phytolaccae]
MRVFRLLILTALAFALTVGDARTAVAPDALPDAAAPFTVTFAAQAGESGGVVVTEITVDGLAAGERVGFACQGCLGQTSVEAVAAGTRQVFRPKLRLTARARLQVRATARNFGRVSEYRVVSSRLRLDRERCTTVADNRSVRCSATRAPRPWATMNVCTPERVGIRAASPSGGSRRQTVAARFKLQYTDPGGQWADVPNGSSPWMTLGAANRSFQGGYTFEFTGVKGRTFRGVAEFEWRRAGRVERRATRFTSPGRTVASGGSSSVCVIP